MDERTYRYLGNTLLVAGLLCFVGGAALVVSGSEIDTTEYVLGALGLLFVGVGSSMTSGIARQ
ncbi:hypothetical protein [Haloarchaeobius sp. DT45]|uniref:hypothetical protein n=1 Tax=Haloarchaeobius sp. DT45 TaxID=3446116 RepID=UPI003F6C4A5F